MALDLIALMILAVFVALGFWRGALATGAGLVSLVVAYAAAVVGAGRFAPLASGRFGLPEVYAPAVAGTLCFALAYLACGTGTLLLKSWDQGRGGSLSRSRLDRFGGAFFGALRGALVVLLLSFLATWIDAARDLGVLAGLDAAPETEDSVASRAAGRVVAGLVENALSDGEGGETPTGRVVAAIASNPGPALGSMMSLLEDERLQRVQEDELFWVLVENGAGERAINQASFYTIVHDEALRRQLADLGLIERAAAEDPDVFRTAMAEMLSELGPRIQGLREDPELHQLARDPEIVALLEAGDTLSLITHPRIQKIVSRVAQR